MCVFFRPRMENVWKKWPIKVRQFESISLLLVSCGTVIQWYTFQMQTRVEWMETKEEKISTQSNVLLFRACWRCYWPLPRYLAQCLCFFWYVQRECVFECVGWLHAVHPLMRATKSKKRLPKKYEGANEWCCWHHTHTICERASQRMNTQINLITVMASVWVS